MILKTGDVGPPPPLYQRETGIFVEIDANGDELRIHIDPHTGRLHAHRWRFDGHWKRWIGPVAYGLSAQEYAACAKAISRANEAG